MKFPALFLGICLALNAQVTFEYDYLKSEILEQRLRQAAPKNPERFTRLKALFEEAGCTGAALREQPVKGSKEPNLICVLPGEKPERIVIGAHFDSVGGDGVIDNWSGSVMLPSLFQTLKTKPHKHTIEFVGFAAEEKGLVGSKAYMKALAKEDRKRIIGMIGLDSLGLASTKCWLNGSDKELAVRAYTLAKAMKLDFSAVNLDKVGETDSSTFKDEGIRVLSLHSVTQATWNTINSKYDVWKALSWKDYYDSYRLVSAFVTVFDQTEP